MSDGCARIRMADGQDLEVSLRVARMISLIITNTSLIDACGLGSVELPFSGDAVKMSLRASIPTRPLDSVKLSR